MFTLGQTFPADSRHIGGQINVTHNNIRTYACACDETKAFFYRRNENTFVVCGILAVDVEDGFVKLALGGGEVRNIEQDRVYYAFDSEHLTLNEVEMILFQEFYPYLE